jgi:hypothetical protein
MAEYRLIIDKRGKTRFMKDARFVSPDKIPLDELDKLFGRKAPEPEPEPVEPEIKPVFKITEKICVFCREYTTLVRLINGQTIPICTNHYYSETTGRIVQRIREIEHAEAEATR